jgi:hypothetical protein
VISGPGVSGSHDGAAGAAGAGAGRTPSAWSGSVRASRSRGGRALSSRTTTVRRNRSSRVVAASVSTAARPVTTPRRNQRGPSTPMNRAGRWPVRPSGVRTGRRASSSRPNGPGTSSTDPPCLPTDSAISSRISSQIPSVRGAAKACIWSVEPSSVTPTAVTAPEALSISIRSSMPGTPGRRRAPRSTRGPAGTSSPESYGPCERSCTDDSSGSSAGTSAESSTASTTSSCVDAVRSSAASLRVPRRKSATVRPSSRSARARARTPPSVVRPRGVP